MLFLGWLLVAAALARGQALSPAWVAVSEGDQAVVRIVVKGARDCPAITIDGSTRPMSLRQPLPEGLRPACEFSIPRGTKTASVNGQTLSLPRANPSRVIALGDTGCRIKGDDVQACNDPDQWPFAQVAAGAADEKPDLVIHVGDYLYREMPVPRTSRRCAEARPPETTGTPGTPTSSRPPPSSWRPLHGRFRAAITRTANVPGAAGFTIWTRVPGRNVPTFLTALHDPVRNLRSGNARFRVGLRKHFERRTSSDVRGAALLATSRKSLARRPSPLLGHANRHSRRPARSRLTDS